MHGHGDARIGRCAAASSQCPGNVHLRPFGMAHHQQALVRYVTLDDCLGRLRLPKEELIERCSRAVDRLSGGGRGLSERTFFSDIKAMREGIVLGREAPIECVDGLYFYTEQGFTMFRAGAAEVEELLERLADREQRALKALAYLKDTNIDKASYDAVVGMLMGEEAELWLLRLDEQERERERGRVPEISFSSTGQSYSKSNVSFENRGKDILYDEESPSELNEPSAGGRYRSAGGADRVRTAEEGSTERMSDKSATTKPERPLVTVSPVPEDPSAWALLGWSRSSSGRRPGGIGVRIRTWFLLLRLRMGRGRR